MNIYHLNCGTFDPVFGLLSFGENVKMTTHVTAIDTGKGLVLIDSGLGLEDCAAPKARLSSFLRKIGRASLDPAETAALQLEAMGYSRDDVTDIVLTHMDPDHTGGLSDFPKARIHVHKDEFQDFSRRNTLLEKERYQPLHITNGRKIELYGQDGEKQTWRGLANAERLRNVDTEILLIPLNGHTRGHSIIAYKNEEKWFIHAGDSYFHRGQIKSGRAIPRSFKLYFLFTSFDKGLRKASELILSRFIKTNPDVTIYCSHDPIEFSELSGR